jgi:predicted nucleic acid-binding protein
VTAFLDTNILIRHLTGDPADQARRATQFLADQDELLVTDLVLAEMVYVLESFYEVAPSAVAEMARAVLAFPAVSVVNPDLLLRAIELYELERLDFADAYLVAAAEVSGVGVVASFDRRIDRIDSVQRLEP